MNLHIFLSETARKAVAAFLDVDWQSRVRKMDLGELKIAVILALAESPNRSCGREALVLRILKLLRVSASEQELNTFSTKIDSVVGILVKQRLVARYRAQQIRVKLQYNFEETLLKLLITRQNQESAMGTSAKTQGPALMTGSLREIDEPAQLKGKTVAHVAIPLDTSYHFRQQVELIFSDKTYCHLYFDREPVRQRDEFARLYRAIRDDVARGKARSDWEAFEYGLRLRGIDITG